MYDIGDKINLAVFPGLQVIIHLKLVAILSQGGPHNHAIAGIAVALKQANSEEFKTYQKQVRSSANDVHKHQYLIKVVRNAQRLADGLIKLG